MEVDQTTMMVEDENCDINDNDNNNNNNSSHQPQQQQQNANAKSSKTKFQKSSMNQVWFATNLFDPDMNENECQNVLDNVARYLSMPSHRRIAPKNISQFHDWKFKNIKYCSPYLYAIVQILPLTSERNVALYPLEICTMNPQNIRPVAYKIIAAFKTKEQVCNAYVTLRAYVSNIAIQPIDDWMFTVPPSVPSDNNNNKNGCSPFDQITDEMLQERITEIVKYHVAKHQEKHQTKLKMFENVCSKNEIDPEADVQQHPCMSTQFVSQFRQPNIVPSVCERLFSCQEQQPQPQDDDVMNLVGNDATTTQQPPQQTSFGYKLEELSQPQLVQHNENKPNDFNILRPLTDADVGENLQNRMVMPCSSSSSSIFMDQRQQQQFCGNNNNMNHLQSTSSSLVENNNNTQPTPPPPKKKRGRPKKTFTTTQQQPLSTSTTTSDNIGNATTTNCLPRPTTTANIAMNNNNSMIPFDSYTLLNPLQTQTQEFFMSLLKPFGGVQISFALFTYLPDPYPALFPYENGIIKLISLAETDDEIDLMYNLHTELSLNLLSMDKVSVGYGMRLPVPPEAYMVSKKSAPTMVNGKLISPQETSKFPNIRRHQQQADAMMQVLGYDTKTS